MGIPSEMGMFEEAWAAFLSLPWDLVVAVLLGFGIGFYVGKFFAEDAGEGERFDYLSGKRRLRE